MLELADENFKTFKSLNFKVFENIKENILLMSEQIENLSRAREAAFCLYSVYKSTPCNSNIPKDRKDELEILMVKFLYFMRISIILFEGRLIN